MFTGVYPQPRKDNPSWRCQYNSLPSYPRAYSMDLGIKRPQKRGGRLNMGSTPWSSSSKSVKTECEQLAISRGLSWALHVVTFPRGSCRVSGWLHWILLLFIKLGSILSSQDKCLLFLPEVFQSSSLFVDLKTHHSSLWYLTKQCLITVATLL